MSFDRVADHYDATRGLPSDVAARLTAMLVAELAGRGRCLEIGVGTGRIALPLAAQGVELVGVDIAPRMLHRLVENSGGHPPVALCVADVTALPLAAGRFGAALASHVLHLIVDWRGAVDEVVRVLGPGAVFLVDFGGHPRAPWDGAAEIVMREQGVVRVRPGMSVPGPVEEHLSARARARPLAPLTMTVSRTLAQDLSEWEGQIHAWTWSADPAQMAAACAGVRRWASENRWPLDWEVVLERTIQWWAFDIGDEGRLQSR
jgi:SAM-dependent methyltransferase